MGPSYLSAPILVVLADSRQRIRVGLRLGVSKGEITPNLRYRLFSTVGLRADVLETRSPEGLLEIGTIVSWIQGTLAPRN
jgi:hypothetical protein